MQKGKSSFFGSYPNWEFAPFFFLSAHLSWLLSVTVSFWRQRRDLHCWQNCSAANPTVYSGSTRCLQLPRLLMAG